MEIEKYKYKTERLNFWRSIVLLLIAIIGLGSLIVTTFWKEDASKESVTNETTPSQPPVLPSDTLNNSSAANDNDLEDESPRTNTVGTQPQPAKYDTMIVVMDARLDRYDVKIDGDIPQMIEATPVVKTVRFLHRDQNRELSLVTSEDKTICSKPFYVEGKGKISLTSSECKPTLIFKIKTEND